MVYKKGIEKRYRKRGIEKRVYSYKGIQKRVRFIHLHQKGYTAKVRAKLYVIYS